MNNKEFICCVDVETTGLSKQFDWIIQLSAVKFRKSDFKIVDEFDTYIKPAGNYEISPAATEVNGLTKEFIEKTGKLLKDVGPDFLKFMDGCDLCGFNSNGFDMEFLQKDFAHSGIPFPFEGLIHYDVKWMQTRLQGNRLVDLFARYTGKTMEEAGLKAHDSLSDVKATVKVMECQFDTFDLKWEDVDTWQENNIFVPDGTVRKANKDDEPERVVFCQGKYKDQDVYTVMLMDPNYMKWAAEKLFSGYTLKVVRDYCMRQKKAAAQ